MLERHGVGRMAAVAVRRVGERLRRRAVGERVEFAALLDAESGAVLDDIRQGGKGEVDIADLLMVLEPRRQYVLLHTHPGNVPFSPDDVGLFVSYPGLRAATVVAARGGWYLFSRQPDARVARADEILLAYQDEEDRLRPWYLALVRSGALSPGDAYNEFPRGVDHTRTQARAPL